MSGFIVAGVSRILFECFIVRLLTGERNKTRKKKVVCDDK